MSNFDVLIVMLFCYLSLMVCILCYSEFIDALVVMQMST